MHGTDIKIREIVLLSSRFSILVLRLPRSHECLGRKIGEIILLSSRFSLSVLILPPSHECLGLLSDRKCGGVGRGEMRQARPWDGYPVSEQEKGVVNSRFRHLLNERCGGIIEEARQHEGPRRKIGFTEL